MKVLAFTKQCLPTKLRDELEASVPSLRPVAGVNGEMFSPLQVEWNGTAVRMTVPNDADESAIAVVVDIHNPTPVRPVIPKHVFTLRTLGAKVLNGEVLTDSERNQYIFCTAQVMKEQKFF